MDEFVTYAGKVVHITEWVCDMQCTPGTTTDQIFEAIARRCKIAHHAPGATQ
jgi:hypothetical protein